MTRLPFQLGFAHIVPDRLANDQAGFQIETVDIADARKFIAIQPAPGQRAADMDDGRIARLGHVDSLEFLAHAGVAAARPGEQRVEIREFHAAGKLHRKFRRDEGFDGGEVAVFERPQKTYGRGRWPALNQLCHKDALPNPSIEIPPHAVSEDRSPP